MNKIDLHVHTIASGHGISTLYEIVRTAKEKGIKAIAVTDHGPKSKGGPEESYFYILCLRVPKIIDSVHIIKGIEANILDTRGNTDIPCSLIPYFDLVLAYMHPITEYKDQGIKNIVQEACARTVFLMNVYSTKTLMMYLHLLINESN